MHAWPLRSYLAVNNDIFAEILRMVSNWEIALRHATH